MTPGQLKYSILKCAFSGKLVETDITACLPKVKEVTFEENLFDIPDTWVWSTLGNCCEMYTGNSISESVKKAKYTGISEGLDYIATKDVTFEKSIVYDNGVRIPFGEDFRIAKAGAVLMCIEGGSAGRKIGIIDKDVCFGNKLCMFNSEVIDNKYIYFYLQSSEFKKLFTDNMSGIIGGVSIKKLKELPIPIPSIKEQHRIVAKVGELLPFIDRYAEAYEKLEQFNAKFPEEMKKSILQYAIQGKLVEQRPEEETAEELYHQIQKEKQKLIKEGKIKKEKPLAEIGEDEIPFDIPASWKWVRVGDIFNVGTGMTPIKSESRFYQNGTIPWVTSSLTSKRYIDKVDTLITKYAIENTSLRLYPEHTLIVAMYGQGKTRGQVSELLTQATINQACAALEYYKYREETTKYVYYCFLFNYEKLREKAEGTSQPNLNIQKIKDTIIPLPPLNEQKRIVAKIEELLPYCDILIK